MRGVKGFSRIFLAIALCAAASQVRAQDDQSYILTTATQGGTYYPVGVAIATMVKVKLTPEKGFTVSAINSAGSAENIRLLRDDEAQFALLQGIYGAWAWHGEGPLKRQGKQAHLRSITALWPNIDHIVLRESYVKSGDLSDLASLDGAKFSIGRRNSGAAKTGAEIFDRLGIDRDRAIDAVYLGYSGTADAIINGTIAGFNMPGGIPLSAVSRAFAGRGDQLRILRVSEEQITRLNARWPVWRRAVIPAGTYPSQADPVETSAMINFLAVRADVPPDVVYSITNAIFDNLAFLRGIHRAAESIDREGALDGLIMPLHEGAARFYEEEGTAIPEALLPPERTGS